MRLWLASLVLFAPHVAAAQLVNPAAIDLSNVATKGGVASVQAAMPQPANTVGPMEAVGGAVGTVATYKRGDWTPARITRAAVATTGASGTFSITWAVPLPAVPVINLTPVAATTSIDCQLTVAPTVSVVQGRCFSAQTSLLNLSIITAGLTLNPVANSPSGVQVHVLAIPPTQ